MSFRAGIIGCGMIAGRFEDWSAPSTYSHAKAYRRHGAFGELGFYDRSTDRASALARKAGGKAYSSADDLLVSFRPDVVSVCVPDNVHYEMIEFLLRSPHGPRAIFAEKPVCSTREEFARLVQLHGDGRTGVLVNHSRRFDPAHQRLKALLASGELGRPVTVHVDYYGGWRHLGVHVVDTLQYFFDAPLRLSHAEYCCASKDQDDPTLNVTGCLESARVRLDGHLEDHYQILDMSLMCERGQIKVTDFGKRINVLRKTVNAEGENVLDLDPACSGVGTDSPMRHAVDVIARYLRGGGPELLTVCDLNEAGKTMDTIWTGMEMYAAQS